MQYIILLYVIDPKPIELIDRTEQQCLPLSCVMRFFSENVHKTDIEPAEPVIQPKTSILPPAPNIFHRPLRTGNLEKQQYLMCMHFII